MIATDCSLAMTRNGTFVIATSLTVSPMTSKMLQAKCIAAILGEIDVETISRKILVTGSAGFIGSALVLRLLSVELMDYIAALEKALGKTVEKKLLRMQAGDVPDTYADVADLVEQIHYKSATTVEEGIQRFVAWCRNEFKLI